MRTLFFLVCLAGAAGQSASFTVAPQAATRVFRPGTGVYATGRKVIISDRTSSAAIYHTIDATKPTASPSKYMAPIVATSTETIEAIAIAAGYAQSATGKSIYAVEPTVLISSSATRVFVGQPFTLSWSSANAGSCASSGAWSGPRRLKAQLSVTATTAGRLTYIITCTGAGGTASAEVTVTAAKPSLSMKSVFSPNGVTISTSEGAPYADCDFWDTYLPGCTGQSNFGYGPTKVVHLFICLSGEVTLGSCSQEPEVTGPLSADMLDKIDSGIAAYSGSGARLLVRFIYNFGPIGPSAKDAPLDVILDNIDQVAPILLKNKDLVFALEAGFIGTWGEWHDSTNGNDAAAAQKKVLDKERSYFSGVFPILVRDPGDIIQYAGDATPVPGLGIHDDYYASSPDDSLTWSPCDPDAGYCLSDYTQSEIESYGSAVSTTTMFAGSFGALYPALQACAALAKFSYMYHPQSLQLSPYPADIGPELQNEGCALSFYNMVGTRIEIQDASIIGNPKPNGRLYVGLTMLNAGYGRVIRERPATLVFLSGGKPVAQIPIPIASLDLRKLASSAAPSPQTFGFDVTLPASFPETGTISANLSIPDPAPSLKPQAAYALPLNSLDEQMKPVFNPTTGDNAIATFGVQ